MMNILGVIKGSTGRAVADVPIILYNRPKDGSEPEAKDKVDGTLSDSKGSFTFYTIPSGLYTLVIDYKGSKTMVNVDHIGSTGGDTPVIIYIKTETGGSQPSHGVRRSDADISRRFGL